MSTEIKVTPSSGNVFADLGLPNPEEHLVKATIALSIGELIEKRGLTQEEAGTILGLPQSSVSNLVRGKLDKFTIERVTLRPEGKGMNVVGHGLVKQVRTKRGEIPIQHSLTALDALWHNARLEMFLTIVSAMFLYSLGAYRLWKEFKR